MFKLSHITTKLVGMSAAVLVAFGSFSTAQADIDDRTPYGEVVRNADGTETARVRLSTYKGRPSMRLVGHTAADKLYFGLSPIVDIKEATLTFDGVHSMVVQEQSLIMIYLNDMITGQLALDQEDGRLMNQFYFDPDLLKAGYNELIFQTAASLGLNCESSKTPQVWSEVNLSKTELTVTYQRKDKELTLADLKALLFPGIGGTSKLNVVTASQDVGTLKAAGLAVQGASIQQQFTIPELSQLNLSDWMAMAAEEVLETATEEGEVSEDENAPVQLTTPVPMGSSIFRNMGNKVLPQVDSILVGKKDDLSGVVDASILAEINGAYLRVASLRGAMKRFVLIVSGQTDEEMALAASALGVQSFPMPDQPSALIDDVSYPETAYYVDLSFLGFDREYQMQDLGYNTKSRKGLSPEPIDINVNLPPDYFASETDDVMLSLSYAYGAGSRADSTLDVEINGQFTQTIALDNSDGARIENYRMPIPLHRFRAGQNTLRLLPKLIPLITGECEWLQDDTLNFTLFDDSKLRLPNVNRFAEVPDLNLFRINGYPYFSALDLDDGTTDQTSMAFYLPQADQASLVATWVLQAKLAQLKGRPLLEAELTDDWAVARDAGHVIAVASDMALPEELSSTIPIPFRDSSRLTPLPAANQNAEDAASATIYPRSLQPGALGRYGALMSYERENTNRLTTLLTASSDAVLAKRAMDLVQGGIWSQMAGGIFIWEDLPETALAFGVQKSVQSGELTSWRNLEYWTGKQPLTWVLGALIALIFLGFVTWLLFARSSKDAEPADR